MKNIIIILFASLSFNANAWECVSSAQGPNDLDLHIIEDRYAMTASLVYQGQSYPDLSSCLENRNGLCIEGIDWFHVIGLILREGLERRFTFVADWTSSDGSQAAGNVTINAVDDGRIISTEPITCRN